MTKDYVINNKELMEDWNWEKNNSLGIFPNKITLGSDKKVWWKCKQFGHEWAASICKRNNGRNCPICANKLIIKGINDLTTTHPLIAKEWDYNKNGELKPENVTYGSTKSVYWKCEENHSYIAKISDRCHGNGCPVCANKKVIKGVNDLATTHPQIAKDWDYENNNGLMPTDIVAGSNKRIFWKCSKCGYMWRTSANNRTNGGTNCPSCSNKVLVKGKNDLQTLYPQIAKKWNYELNKLKPNEVFAHSNKKAWWICDKDKRHIFDARIDHIAKGLIICPVCANQRIIIGVNDLATTNPELLDEWDYTKNIITPQQVTYGVNKKTWWKCKKGHEWQATIASRAGFQKTECPYCKNELKVSIPEKALAYYLSQYYQIEESKHFEWLNKMEIDIYIPQLNLGIEYDGRQWHKNIERDLKKDKLCAENSLKLIRIREVGCPKYETSSFFVYVNIDKDPILQLKEIIKQTFNFINKTFNTNLNSTPNIGNDYIEILDKTLTISKENSVNNHILINEWNYDKNKVNPEYISLGSDKKVWWKCKKGHEWQATVSSRTGSMKCGCPYCAGQKVLSGDNDLETLFPEIAKEWNYIKNDNIKPNQIRPQTNKKYWWKCESCGYEWQTSPSQRVRGRNCPKCARQITISSHYKKVLNIETNKVYKSIVQASNETKISQGNIGNCCRGKSKTAGGYHWKFIDIEKD